MNDILHIPFRALLTAEQILRDRAAHLAAIHRRDKLPALIARLSLVTVLSLSVYGFVMGLSGGRLLQALCTAFKLPALFVLSGLICLPTLYQFSILCGSRLRFLQALTVVLTSHSLTAILALGFSPITFLFWISGADPLFLVALNSAVLALVTALGLILIVQGMLYVQEDEPPTRLDPWGWAGLLARGALRSLVLLAWLVVYGLVAVQLAWTLRPFFGVPLEGATFWQVLYNLTAALLG